MTNWKSLVESFLKRADPSGEFRSVVRPGASPEAIAAAECQLGMSMPEELRSFYLNCNGMGLACDDEPDSPRLIPPIETLPAVVEQCRSWFAETHPGLASRFLPFLDWENGDYVGYLHRTDGTFEPFLSTFNHERYRASAAQDAREFLERGPSNLAEFLGQFGLVADETNP